jgi:hypothetical protein
VKSNSLPGLKVSMENTVKGKPMLVMERLDKSGPVVEEKARFIPGAKQVYLRLRENPFRPEIDFRMAVRWI